MKTPLIAKEMNTERKHAPKRAAIHTKHRTLKRKCRDEGESTKKPDEQGLLVATVSKYDSETKKYKLVDKIPRPAPVPSRQSLSREAKKARQDPISISWEHDFPHGGRLRVYLSLLDKNIQEGVSTELRESGCFRSYKIQAGNEPRAHFLIHEDATEDFDNEAQPGYSYARTSMKGHSLSRFPMVKELAGHMRQVCGIDSWNIGMNPVLYRDGNDHMGFHSDNDQGEETILSVLVESPPRPRRLIIKPKKKHPEHGDHKIVLFLYSGDGYDMDGK